MMAGNDNCRVGVILMINGSLNALSSMMASQIAKVIIDIVRQTIVDNGEKKFD